ncbi:hypothetical protein C5614_12965 [Massilia phosphatilytica]|nr:hypothetical protein C5614_12965 [Massilia phosphatilytica]
MTTRYLIAVALLVGSACGAQAEVLSATGTAAQSGFLSGWTSGNGSDVVSSGVLSNGVSLVGGAAYGSGNLAEALYQKASATVGQTGTQVKLSYSQGIEGTYLLSTSNAKLAAMLGNGMGVVSTADGKVITPDQGGGGASNGNGGGFSGAPAPAASPSKGGNAPSAGNSVDGAPSGNYGNSNGATVITPAAGGQEGGAIVQLPIPAHNGQENSNGNGNGGIGGDIGAGLPAVPAAAAVPEPSSIALMMAGMLGAMGVVRRRKR